MAEIYLVRHGSTAHNHDDPKKDKVKGTRDVPLDERGINAAHQAGEFLAKQGITHILASPLSRSLETAKIISQHTGAPVGVTPRLNPWDVGMYAGKPYYSVSHFLKWHQQNPEAPVPGGQSYGEWHNQFSKGLPELIDFASQPGNKVATVLFSRHLLALDSALKGEHPSKVAKPYGAASPGSVSRLRIHSQESEEK
jgi:broad specificity phosphatase PhoE